MNLAAAALTQRQFDAYVAIAVFAWFGMAAVVAIAVKLTVREARRRDAEVSEPDASTETGPTRVPRQRGSRLDTYL